MMKFVDHYKTAEVRGRYYCISHAVAEVLSKQKSRKIIELGCHVGQNCKDIVRILDNVNYTGVDWKKYVDEYMKPMEFILSDVIGYVYNTNDKFDLTLCSWILVHLKNVDDSFWDKLAELSTYLVTYENEVQQKRNLKTLFESHGLIEIRHDTFNVFENVYEMRTFKNKN